MIINDISRSKLVRYFCGTSIPAMSMISHKISWWDIYVVQVKQVIQVIQLIQVMQVRLGHLWPDFRVNHSELRNLFFPGNIQEPDHLVHGAAPISTSNPNIACCQQNRREHGGSASMTFFHRFAGFSPQVTTKSFAFAGKNDLPLYYVSAADGTNVVKMFRSRE